jgi:DNA polymerase III delta subunit
MSDSEAHLRDEVIRQREKWGFKSSNVKTTETWNPALTRGSVSLFGEPILIHLDLSDKNRLKSFVEMIDDKKSKYFEDHWFGQGVIITSTHAQGTKKIENLIKKSGGKVIKKAKPAEMVKILLNRVNLPKESKDFLKDYAGENYEILFSIVNQIEKMDKSEQQNTTIEDLIIRLPSKPGAVPPWEFINPMLEGDAKKAIKLYERAIEGSHILVTMTFAKSNLQLLYRLKVLQSVGIWKSNEQAETIGERNGPKIWNAANVAKKVDIKTAEYLAKLALATEANLKGHSSANPDIIFKNFIAAVCIAIDKNKALPLTLTRRE